VKVVKNKVAPPFKEVEFNIIYGKGISRMAEILDMAVEFDIIEKRGSWYRYGGEPIGQGTDNAIEFLESDPELTEKIEQQVREQMNPTEDSEDASENGQDKSDEEDDGSDDS
jgi:recombination protein RecA